MEKCPNCGAAVRPGAKFCTSCGTRLNDSASPSTTTTSWNQSGSAEETMVATPAAEPEKSPDAPAEERAFSTWNQGGDSWAAAASATDSRDEASASSPADRFETGLDQPSTSSESEQVASESSTNYRPSTWQQSTSASEETEDDRFASWSAAYGAYQATSEEGTSALTPESEEPSAPEAGAPESSVDETGQSSGPSETPRESEARQRATKLVEELRGLIWRIGVGDDTGTGDENLAVIVLAGARGQTGEFSDIKRALDGLRDDPRDIDALRALGAKADRIEELLNSHSRLLAAMDEAIDELR